MDEATKLRMLIVDGLLTELKPPVRSSDYGLVRSDPFMYLLTRRLGLQPALRYSEALNQGSWFHRRGEVSDLPQDEAREWMQRAYLKKFRELERVFERCKIGTKGQETILTRERKDWQCAIAWHEVASTLPVTRAGENFVEAMFSGKFRVLGREVLISTVIHGSPAVAQLDSFTYEEAKRRLWIDDYKTCASSPRMRLSTCAREFQPKHYFEVARNELPLICKHFGLPDDVRLAGVRHVAIQKPTIRISGEDREYVEKVGPRGGVKKNYRGEPLLENYIKRCELWYKAEGQFEHEREARLLDPPVDISTTHANILLDVRHRSWYLRAMREIDRYRLCNLDPCLFPPGNSGPWGSDRAFDGFYHVTADYWPDIVRKEQLVLTDRDAGSPPPPSILVLGANA